MSALLIPFIFSPHKAHLPRHRPPATAGSKAEHCQTIELMSLYYGKSGGLDHATVCLTVLHHQPTVSNPL